MSNVDPVGDKSWTIRIGTGGNMYSHYAPDMYGETLPPQVHAEAPWIDEVQQSVSVNTQLNEVDGDGKLYYIHQAGAYQRDDPGILSTAEDPFYSPGLARHCEGNYCMFASWGTQAHVATPYTSPVIYVNKYVNCGGGVIEHVQMIHK